MARRATTKKVEEKMIEIEPVRMASMDCFLLGKTPLIMHRFAKKAWQELLLPGERKNKAARASSLKHDPLNEFRECVYLNRSAHEPTAIHFPSGAFSKAIAAAALDLPGATKAQILRLVSIKTQQVNIYGIPVMGMDMVRSSDAARTPDVRTRAYFPEWACKITIEYVSSLIGEGQIVNLLGAAGIITGLGDYRPQKGGSLGKFEIVQANDRRYLQVMKQSRKAQEASLRSPSFYNDDAAELYGWFCDEVERREKTLESSKRDGKPKAQPKTLVAANALRKAKGKGRRANGRTVN